MAEKSKVTKSKVENKKKKALPSDEVYNDSDKLNDLLISLKNINKLYGTFQEEASNDLLFTNIGDLAKDMGQCARDSFNLMFEKGWYKLEQQSEDKIKTIHQQYKKEQSKLNQ